MKDYTPAIENQQVPANFPLLPMQSAEDTRQNCVKHPDTQPQDLQKHLMVETHHKFDPARVIPDDFLAELNAMLGRNMEAGNEMGELVLFVHGYNTSFADAIGTAGRKPATSSSQKDH